MAKVHITSEVRGYEMALEMDRVPVVGETIRMSQVGARFEVVAVEWSDDPKARPTAPLAMHAILMVKVLK